MHALLATLRDRLHPLTPRGRTEARLARIAADPVPAFAHPIFAPLRGRIVQIRISHDGFPTSDPIPDASAHLRTAL